MRVYRINQSDILLADSETNQADVVDEDEIAKAFSKSLCEIRQASGLSLVQLGKEIDMPNQTLSAYERGVRIPSFLQALRITSFFGYTIEDFILSGLDLRNLSVAEEYELAHSQK